MTARRGLLVAGAATALAVAVFVSLGTWQMRRLSWKHRLIAEVSARTTAPPIEAPHLDDPLARDGDALDYRRVHVEGHFVAGIEGHVQALLGEPRGRLGGPGVWVMAPLARPGGEVVWINRGFVPSGRTAEATPVDPTATVTIDGLARREEPRGFYTPADEPAKNVWFVRDGPRLSAAYGLPADATLPYTIDAGIDTTPASGLPQAGETRLAFPDNHLGYALTWYGLALAAIGVFAVRVRGERRRTAAPSPSPH